MKSSKYGASSAAVDVRGSADTPGVNMAGAADMSAALPAPAAAAAADVVDCER